MDKLQQYASKIEEITTFVNNLLQKIDQKTDDQPKAFFYVLAFKTNNGLNTTNLLIANVIKKPHFCDSLLILLRAMLADTITFIYLAVKLESNNTDEYLKEQIAILEGDHIRYMDKTFGVFQKLYGTSDKEIGRLKKEIRAMHPVYFSRDGKYKNEYKTVSIPEMVTVIAESNNDVAKLHTKNAFELYDTFSKLEHLGILTTQLVVRQFDDGNQKKILQEIYVAVQTILFCLGSVLQRFFPKEEMEHFGKLEEEILQIKIHALHELGTKPISRPSSNPSSTVWRSF